MTSIWDLSSFSELEGYVHQRFPSLSHSWMPQSVEVNGRKDRRALCVISQDRLHYAMFDLDSRHEGEDGQDNLQHEAGGSDDDEMLM